MAVWAVVPAIAVGLRLQEQLLLHCNGGGALGLGRGRMDLGSFDLASEASATASGAERTIVPSSQAGQQVMPASCSIICSLAMPERRAREARRDMASSCAESHPPALPSVENTSNG